MKNFTDKISVKLQEEIKNYILAEFEAICEPKQYAFWQLRNSEFVAIFYNSSKFVIQGKNIDLLLKKLAEKFSEFSAPTAQSLDGLEEEIQKSEHIGTDESGKGDFFGPLVIAGVKVTEKNRQMFIDAGIRDSKTLKDKDMLKMAAQIKNNSDFSVIAISNEKYNELYKKFKNLNRLLAWGHAKVIENILQKSPCEIALSDKFADESLIQNALQKNGKKIKLYQRTKAESDIAVAAASVLARATFVLKMQEMDSKYGLNFPKGANSIVKKTASDFIKHYGKERLIEVVRTHFKKFKWVEKL